MNLQYNLCESIKRYENRDLSFIKDFYERSYRGDIAKKLQAFQWVTEYNPCKDRDNNDNNYVLIFKNGRIAGYWGLMPARFYFFGKTLMCVFSQEALVDPCCRGKGIGRKLMEEVNRSGNLIISLWHNNKILTIQNNAGYVNIGNYRPLKKLFHPENVLKDKLRNRFLLRIAIILWKSYCRLRQSKVKINNNYDIEVVKKCSKEFDELFMRVSPKLGMLSYRTAEILNWKYIDIPFKQYLFLAARKKGRILGYAVLRIHDQDDKIRKGIIVDLLCDPEDPEPLKCLARKCDEIFLENKVDLSVCLVNPKIFRNVFINNGYFQARSRNTDSIWIYNQDRSPNPELTNSIANWYFTYGDSDGDMW